MTTIPKTMDTDRYTLLIQDTRTDIINEILGHPKQMPSTKELAHYCDVATSTIRYHMEKLIGADIVEQLKQDGTSYYTLTGIGWRILWKSGWLRELPVHQVEFAQRDPPADLVVAASADRPTPSFAV